MCRDDQLIAGAGGRDIKQCAFCLEGIVAFGFAQASEFKLEGEYIPAHAEEDDVGEFHAFGAVHGHDTYGFV